MRDRIRASVSFRAWILRAWWRAIARWRGLGDFFRPEDEAVLFKPAEDAWSAGIDVVRAERFGGRFSAMPLAADTSEGLGCLDRKDSH